MKTTNPETLKILTELLATDGWYVFEYKVVASNTVTLTIVLEL